MLKNRQEKKPCYILSYTVYILIVLKIDVLSLLQRKGDILAKKVILLGFICSFALCI